MQSLSLDLLESRFQQDARAGGKHVTMEASKYRRGRPTRANPCGMFVLLAEAPGAALVLSCAAVSPNTRLIVRTTRTGVEDMLEIACVVCNSRLDLPVVPISSFLHDRTNISRLSTLCVIPRGDSLQSDIQTVRGILLLDSRVQSRMTRNVIGKSGASNWQTSGCTSKF